MSFQNEEHKLDWMYKGVTSLIDREEYLLGRKIDKTLELLDAEEKQKELGITQPKNHVEHECIPPSIRDYNKIQVGEQQVDLATKLQEDPLVTIKKREEETRKQFLQNPIQLKKLQSTLDKQLKKRKKKSKTHKSSNEIDILITKKLQGLKGGSFDFSVFSNSYNVLDEKNLEKILLKKFRKYKSHLTENDLKEILENTKVNQNDEITSKDSDSEENSNYVSRNKACARKEIHQKRKPFKKQDYQDRKVTQYVGNGRVNLTEEERGKRRREMMENAIWRDEERTNNVKRYREEDTKESKTLKSYNTEFLHRELMKSANSESIESRIKSNINSIQRNKDAMNKHFSRRT